MSEYRVRWEIDVDADTPEEAAARALIVQRDNDAENSATIFDVSCRNGNKFEAPIQIDITDRT